MINKNEWLVVGLITSCHGISGQVKVKSLSDFDERFLKPGKRWLQKEYETPAEIELTSGFKQPGKETFIIKFQGINTRNHAEQLKKFIIYLLLNYLKIKKKFLYHLLKK
jgi:16S rRNA processing protein RimM